MRDATCEALEAYEALEVYFIYLSGEKKSKCGGEGLVAKDCQDV